MPDPSGVPPGQEPKAAEGESPSPAFPPEFGNQISERVQRIRSQIAAGRYKVKAEDVAEKLVSQMIRRGTSDTD